MFNKTSHWSTCHRGFWCHFIILFIILLIMHACKHTGFICTIQILVKGQLGKQHYRYNKFSSGLFAKQMRMT